MNRLLRLWCWEPQGLGPYETVRARLMWRVLLVMAALETLTIPIQLVQGPAWIAVVPVGFVLNYAFSAFLLRQGRQQLAAWLIVAPAFLVLPALIALFGGIGGTATIFLQIAALLAVLWLERGALGVVALLVAIVLAWPLWNPRFEQVFSASQLSSAMLFSYVLAVSMIATVAGSTLDALRLATAEAAERARDARRAAAAAVRAAEAKTRFLAMMSHELRTPLNAIVGYAELLHEDHDADADDLQALEHRAHLERIAASGHRLMRLVDDVLEVARTMRAREPDPVPEVELPTDVGARLVLRSVQTLVAGTVIASSVQLFGADRLHVAARTLPYLTLFCAALAAAAAGRPRAAAWSLVLFGSGSLLFDVAVEGPSCREAPYLLLTVVAAWSWLGRREGIAAAVAALGALIVGAAWGQPPLEPVPQVTWGITHAVSLAIAAAFLRTVTRYLRAATSSARDQALAAEAGAAAARDADEARDRFLARVSHDVRVPLQEVLRDAALVRAAERDEARIEDLDRIRAAGLRLLALIDDVLDMRSLGRGELVVRRGPVDLAPVVHNAVRAVVATAASRDDRISVRIPPDLPPFDGDEQRIGQILTSLLSNAVKHTDGGEIRVQVSGADGELRVAVQDQGAGIPNERLPEVFEPFVQLNDGPDRQPGIGLGLALSQQLARVLGGRIDACSCPGGGSTFTLALPCRPWAGDPASLVPTSAASPCRLDGTR